MALLIVKTHMMIVVNLLADFREMDIDTDGMSLAGVASRLQQRVNDRDWRPAQVHAQNQAVCTNFG